MKRMYFIVCIIASTVGATTLYALDVEQSFKRTAQLQEEMKFWEDELKRLQKQQEKGNVTPAYLMMLNGILTQMQALRKEAVTLIDQTQKEEEKIKKEQEEALSTTSK